MYRQLPPHLTTTNTLLQPVISLDRPPPRIINHYTNAVLQTNFNTKITSIDDNTLYGYHFQRLHQNSMIHDTVVHACLRLIQRRSQGTVKAMDFITIHRLKQGNFSHIDRQFRTKDIFAHDWILFPILKTSHFTLIAVRPHHNGRNHILFYDSLSQDCTEEVTAVHNYLRHVASHTHRPEYETWDIDMHATVAMDRQQDSVNCGIYTAMFADSITTEIPLSALTNDFIQRCRDRMATCLLQNKASHLTKIMSEYGSGPSRQAQPWRNPTPMPKNRKRTKRHHSCGITIHMTHSFLTTIRTLITTIHRDSPCCNKTTTGIHIATNLPIFPTIPTTTLHFIHISPLKRKESNYEI